MDFSFLSFGIYSKDLVEKRSKMACREKILHQDNRQNFRIQKCPRLKKKKEQKSSCHQEDSSVKVEEMTMTFGPRGRHSPNLKIGKVEPKLQKKKNLILAKKLDFGFHLFSQKCDFRVELQPLRLKVEHFWNPEILTILVMLNLFSVVYDGFWITVYMLQFLGCNLNSKSILLINDLLF